MWYYSRNLFFVHMSSFSRAYFIAYIFNIAHHFRKDTGWIHLQHASVTVALTFIFFSLKTGKKIPTGQCDSYTCTVANGCQVVSIQVYSEVSRPWLNERTKFTQNAPLFTRTTVNLKWTKFLCSFTAWVCIETTGSFASESHQRANHVTCFENTKTYKLIRCLGYLGILFAIATVVA